MAKRLESDISDQQTRRSFWIFSWASTALYILAAAVLLLLSLTMIGTATWNVVAQALGGGALVSEILQSIGLIVISIAVFDVAKFLVEEEVLRRRELRSPREARKSLTKFMTIIIIASSLEALVIVFETKQNQVSNLIYPTGLLMAAVLALIGLAVFQWLSRASEPPSDRFDEGDVASRDAGEEA